MGDPFKELPRIQHVFIKTDCSKSGLDYILLQEGDEPAPPPPTEKEKKEGGRKCLGTKLIQLDATGLSPAQKNWSISEIELLVVVWALEHSKFYE